MAAFQQQTSRRLRSHGSPLRKTATLGFAARNRVFFPVVTAVIPAATQKCTSYSGCVRHVPAWVFVHAEIKIFRQHKFAPRTARCAHRVKRSRVGLRAPKKQISISKHHPGTPPTPPLFFVALIPVQKFRQPGPFFRVQRLSKVTHLISVQKHPNRHWE